MTNHIASFCSNIMPAKRLNKIIGWVCLVNILAMLLAWAGFVPSVIEEALHQVLLATGFTAAIIWSIGYKEGE